MTTEMTTGKIPSQLIRFTIPLVLGNLFQLTYNAVDSIIVGNYVGVKGLAAIGCTNPLMNTAYLFMSGMCMGASILMSMSYGSKDTKRLNSLLSTTFLGGSFFCILVSILGIIITPALLKLIQVPADIRQEASLYLRIIFLALLFTFLYNFLANSMRALGDSKTPLIFLALSAFLNVLGDIILVTQLNMGVSGAAISTALSELLCMLCCLLYIHFKVPALHLGKKWFFFEKDLFREIVRFSITSALQQTCLQIGKVIIQSVADSMGLAVMATFSIINRIDDFAYTPQQNIGHAMTTFLAQNKGACKTSRIKAGFITGLILEISYTLLLASICILVARPLIQLFIDQSESAYAEEITTLGISYLHLIAFMYFLPAFTNGIQGYFRGMGKLTITLISTFLNMFGRVLAVFLLAYKFHITISTFAFSNLIGWILMLLFEVPLLFRHFFFFQKESI